MMQTMLPYVDTLQRVCYDANSYIHSLLMTSLLALIPRSIICLSIILRGVCVTWCSQQNVSCTITLYCALRISAASLSSTRHEQAMKEFFTGVKGLTSALEWPAAPQ